MLKAGAVGVESCASAVGATTVTVGNRDKVAFVRFWPDGPGPLIILKNILSQICSRTIFKINTAPGACLLYDPGAVLISNMVLEHI